MTRPARPLLSRDTLRAAILAILTPFSTHRASATTATVAFQVLARLGIAWLAAASTAQGTGWWIPLFPEEWLCQSRGHPHVRERRGACAACERDAIEAADRPGAGALA